MIHFMGTVPQEKGSCLLLNQRHTEYLAERGINDKNVIERRGYESVTEGLLIPWFTVPDGLPGGYEVRLDDPQEGRKFSRPTGQSTVLNVHPDMITEVQDVGTPLFIVEGTSRADVLAQVSIPSVSIPGCFNFMADKAVLPDWDSVPMRDREIIIGLDGDYSTNENVNMALHRLAALVQRKGAGNVTVLNIPGGAGLDDYLVGMSGTLRIMRKLDTVRVPYKDVAVLKPKKLSREARARKVVGDVNDTALAEAFIQSEYNRTLYLPVPDSYASYVDGRWVQTSNTAFLGGFVADFMIETAAALGHDPEAQDYLLSSQKIGSVMTAVRRSFSTFASTEDFDSDPWLLNCANGTLDLRTGLLKDHDPSDLLWGLCPTNWDPTAECPMFEQFISEILPDEATANTVQEILGSALVGEPLAQILPVFIGEGRNGKSLLVNTVGQVLGNDFFGDIDGKLLTAQKFDSHPENIMRLRGKRLAIASETESGDKFATASIKRLTGGDMLTGRFMRENSTNFRPTHSVVLITNNHPQVDDQGAAIWARLKKVPFTVSFLGREDLGLALRLLTEREGILRWLVDGQRRAMQRGKVLFSPEIEAATGSWREDENSLLAFVNSGVVVKDPKASMATTELQALYADYCVTNSLTPLRGRAFGAAMKAEGFTPARTNTERRWDGLRSDGTTAQDDGLMTSSEENPSPENPQVKGTISSVSDTYDTYNGGNVLIIPATPGESPESPGELQYKVAPKSVTSVREMIMSRGADPSNIAGAYKITRESDPKQVDHFIPNTDMEPLVALWAKLLTPIAELTDRDSFDKINESAEPLWRDANKKDLHEHFTLTLDELASLAAGEVTPEGYMLPRTPLDLRRSLYRCAGALDTVHGLGVYLRRTDGALGEFRKAKEDRSDRGKEALLICKWE